MATRPWSQIYVDGRLVGTSPQTNIRVAAGTHRLTLVNPDLDIRQNISVTVRSGETVTKVVRLEPD